MNKKVRSFAILIQAMLFVSLLSAHLRADTGTCGGVTTTLPFTDVGSSIFFCQIAEAFFSGLTNGTSPTTYSPTDPVTREQMAAFITRTMDQSLKRGDRRAALGQWATPASVPMTALTSLGVNFGPEGVQSDGLDLWAADFNSGCVSRVRASDGTTVSTNCGMPSASSLIVARGRVYVTGNTTPGKVFVLVSSTGGGGFFSVNTLATVGNGANGITTDV